MVGNVLETWITQQNRQLKWNCQKTSLSVNLDKQRLRWKPRNFSAKSVPSGYNAFRKAWHAVWARGMRFLMNWIDFMMASNKPSWRATLPGWTPLFMNGLVLPLCRTCNKAAKMFQGHWIVSSQSPMMLPSKIFRNRTRSTYFLQSHLFVRMVWKKSPVWKWKHAWLTSPTN